MSAGTRAFLLSASCALCALLTTALPSAAQTGSIQGIVTAGSSGQVLTSAVVVLEFGGTARHRSGLAVDSSTEP